MGYSKTPETWAEAVEIAERVLDKRSPGYVADAEVLSRWVVAASVFELPEPARSPTVATHTSFRRCAD